MSESRSSAALRLEDVHASYGPFRALFGVSLEVPDGGVVALLGPNGSGKTTVARVASGLLVPTEGRVLFDGRDVTGWAPWRVARLGLAHAVEGRSVFASLSVEENLRLAFHRSASASNPGQLLDHAYDAFPRLRDRRSQSAGTLSGGEQRMLSLARVLADPPRVLIADELSLGLAPVLVDSVYEALAAIRAAGTSLLIVEQQVRRAIEVADLVVVLTKGVVGYSGPPAGLGDVTTAYTRAAG